MITALIIAFVAIALTTALTLGLGRAASRDMPTPARHAKRREDELTADDYVRATAEAVGIDPAAAVTYRRASVLPADERDKRSSRDTPNEAGSHPVEGAGAGLRSPAEWPERQPMRPDRIARHP